MTNDKKYLYFTYLFIGGIWMMYKEFFSIVMVLVVILVGSYFTIFSMKRKMHKTTLFLSLLLAVIIIYAVKGPLQNQEILSGICWVVFFITGLIIADTIWVLSHKEEHHPIID